MLYKFKSAASGDLIMLAAHGDALLRVLGREPAARGIIEVLAMPRAIEQIQAAMQAGEAPLDSPSGGATANKAEDAHQEPRIGLHQRWWPKVQMLQRSLADGVPIVWGV